MSDFNPVDPWSHGFVLDLVKQFGSELEILLALRRSRARGPGGTLAATVSSPVDPASIATDWRCSPPPLDLLDRRVEITGPAADSKMVAKAMSSGAQGYMIDSEDSLSPTWNNVLATQRNLFAVVRSKNSSILSPTLHYRPRGLHMTEVNVTLEGFPVPAALFDFGMFAYWNATELVARGSGPYLYLPKLETEQEADWWHRVMDWTEDRLELPRGTFRCTVLVETLPALMRLESIVYVLRTRLTGLNVGRWDYVFSCVKVLAAFDDRYTVPDRLDFAMTTPQLTEYARWVVHVAHRRGCHAIGGMAAQVPSRNGDPSVNATAYMAVELDKIREVEAGHDGTWVAHPALVPVALAAFDSGLHGRVEQRGGLVTGPSTLDRELVCSPVVGRPSRDGIKAAARTALLYLDAWLMGRGCVLVDGKMEDVATCEVSRVLLWHWANSGAEMSDGDRVDREAVVEIVRGEAAALGAAGAEPQSAAVELLIHSITSQDPPDFITTLAYNILTQNC